MSRKLKKFVRSIDKIPNERVIPNVIELPVLKNF